MSPRRGDLMRALVGLGATLLLAACAQGAPTPSPQPKSTAARPTTVQVTTVRIGAISAVASYAGSIQARSQVHVLPKLAGRITKLYFDIGSRVQAGEPIVELDRAVLEAQVKQAEAGVKAAEAKLAQLRAPGRAEDVAAARAAMTQAEARYQTLVDGATEAERQAGQSQLEAAQAQLKQAESAYARLIRPPSDDDLAQAKANLEKVRAALVRARSEYDRVSWRNDIQATQQAAALQSATADYEAARAAYNLRVEPPKAEDVRAAEQAIASAQASVEAANARIRQLDEGPTQNDLTAAAAAVEQARQVMLLRQRPFSIQDVQVGVASVEQARAALEIARVNLEETTLCAPFDGIVSQKLLSEGAMAAPTTPILALVSVDVEVVINVEEARIGQLGEGQRAALTVAAHPGVEFPAEVRTISPTADPKNRTFAVRLIPTTNDGRLRDGMFAQVSLPTGERENVLLVPRSALVERDGKQNVYVHRDGKAVLTPVQVGLVSGADAEVQSGLHAGDQVVLAEGVQLTDGALITLGGR